MTERDIMIIIGRKQPQEDILENAKKEIIFFFVWCSFFFCNNASCAIYLNLERYI